MVKVDGINLKITEELQNTLRNNPPISVRKPVISKRKDPRNSFVAMQEIDEDGHPVFYNVVKSTHPLVHFDAEGNFYFTVFRSIVIEHNGHNLEVLVTNPKVKTKKDCNLYGKGIYSHAQAIPGSELWDDGSDRTIPHGEAISKGDPRTKIVKTMTRDEVLEIDVKPQGNDALSQFLNLTPAQQAVFAEKINKITNNQ